MTNTTAPHNIANIAQKMVAHSVAINDSNIQWDVFFTGICTDSKHYYMNDRGGPAVNAIQQKRGKYIGSRFPDGSAIALGGHEGNRFPIEFLGTFHGEQA